MLIGSFKEWSSKTTWHGINDGVTAERYHSRIEWIVVLSVSFLMFTSGIYSHIHEYAHGDTWVTISQMEEHAGGIEFPKFVICDLNLVSKKVLKKINMSVEVAKFIVKTVQGKKAAEHEKVAFFQFMDSERSITKWVELIAPNCEDLLLTCSIGPSASEIEFPCCDNVKPIFVPERGRCFDFEIPPFLLQKFPQTEVGTSGSLEILANPFQEDYAQLNNIGFESGLIIYAGYDALSSLYSTPVAVSPDSKNYISMSVEKARIKYRNKTYPNILYAYFPELPCKLDGHLKILAGTYQRESCIEDCRLQAELDICGCVRFHSVKNESVLCDPIQWHNCFIQLTQLQTIYEQKINSCQIGCTRECNSSSVMLRQSASTMFRSISNASLAPMEIFFENVCVYSSVQQEREPIQTLISNIGGTLAVWAGISLITVYQGLQYLFYGIINSMRRRHNVKVYKV